MTFDTKIAIAVRLDLAVWQKLNVVAFLASGVAAAAPECVGEPYADADGTPYARLIGQPMLLYGGDGAALARALERALSRGLVPGIYTEKMFATTHDAANRAAVAEVGRASLKLVGMAIRAERKTVDKVVDGLRFHP